MLNSHRFLFGIGLAIGLGTSAAWCQEARAAEAEPAVRKIGVVDVTRLLKGYKKTQVSEEQLEKVMSQKKADREKKVSEIQNLRDEMMLMNQENQGERRKQIEEKLKNLALFDRETRDSLRKERDEALEGLLSELEKAVQEYAKQQGYDLVLNEATSLYAVEAADLTDEILGVVNR